jgi:phenylalanyl-tRNA synthetase alpha chain
MALKNVKKLEKQFFEDLKKIDSTEELESLRIQYLGKNGKLRNLTAEISSLSKEEKKEFGIEFNKLKNKVEAELNSKEEELGDIGEETLSEFYKSLPGKKPKIGHLHLITHAIREIIDIFKPLGFTRVRYPEVEWEYYAFEALNVPADHPSRDEWETFFVNAPKKEKLGEMLITPHTSSGQVREMLNNKPPIRMLNISRCGRRQSDVTHVPTFYQFEGLLVDKEVSITHLKGVLDYFARNFFGPDREIRLRPYDFRFTEPSFEVDINCGLCLGKGCRFCKAGWHELGGAGMVHPSVLKAGNIDPEKYSGFAFGWGVERTYMMKSGTNLDDIRQLFSNDLRFLEQF